MRKYPEFVGNIRIYNIQTKKTEKTFDFGFATAKCMKWNRNKVFISILNIFENFEKENILAIGLDDGCLVICDVKGKIKKSNFEKKDAILILDWDHHSPDYLLLGHKNGEILLVDSDKMVLLQAFEKMATGLIFSKKTNILKKFQLGISALAWIKGIPGGFLTTTEKLSTLKIWSVSGRFVFLI